MVFKRRDAFQASKHGVDMWVYTGRDDLEQAAVAYQETERGHAQEFRHHRSAFVFYILEGSGEWVIDGETYPVEATDVVVVPPGRAFYYRGRLKQICVTAPAWEEAYEEEVRKVAL